MRITRPYYDEYWWIVRSLHIYETLLLSSSTATAGGAIAPSQATRLLDYGMVVHAGYTLVTVWIMQV